MKYQESSRKSKLHLLTHYFRYISTGYMIMLQTGKRFFIERIFFNLELVNSQLTQ